MDASQQYHDPQSSYRHPVPGQLHGHAGVVRDAEFLVANAAGNHLSDEDRVDRSPPVENTTTQGQPQGLQYFYYDMPMIPLRHTSIAQAAPPVAVYTSPGKVDIFDEPTRNVAGGPAQAFLYERPQQDPVPIG
ncbi:hypothetical protein BJV77DRAFT_961756 [Russula vinacea]|nr:hypothetical protein BJV77DRAFT_961756 [Russula vinacea]